MRYDEIKPYIEKGLVNEQVHPEDSSVRIFNYTQVCQFSQAWDEVTKQCRGLIMNIDTGEILARPFPKFFNYQDHVAKQWPVPATAPEVFEKLDGSLGIHYELNGKQWIATRGSFTSDQAQWATAWWREHIGYVELNAGITHLFEIIYPQNRIVVSYDFSGLVYLASIDIATGRTAFKDRWPDAIRRAKLVEYTDMDTLAKMDEPNSEGFVLYYPEENVRMKIKFAEYVRLHKLVTGLSEIAIWEHMRDGKTLADLLEKVPDEFFKWAGAVQRKLHDRFDAIQFEASEDYVQILDALPPPIKEDYTEYRKSFAHHATGKKYPGILFAMLDNKSWQPIIWKMVRPHGASAFKKDIDA